MFNGSIVALITPFKGGELDLASFKRIVDYQLNSGTKAILFCGSTGEGTSLTNAERAKMLASARKIIGGRIPIILGASCNNKQSIDELIKLANDSSVDAMLICPPFYIKPGQDAIYDYYRYISSKLRSSIIIYNIPGRTSVNIRLDTLKRISRLRNVVAIKESSGDLTYSAKIVSETSLTLLAGDDPMAFHIYSLGGKGVVSVAANIAPVTVQKCYELYRNGSHDSARKIHLKYLDLYRNLFIETNPMPVKYIARVKRLINSEECRFPLGKLSSASKKVLSRYKSVS